MLVESKSNLARLMATENLLVEQRQVPTACFDVKNRILTIPVLNGNLSNELIDLLLSHEVGHALETPEQGWHDSIVDLKVNRSILNVCEDARIEKKIKRKFPGIRISFLKGYRELLEMNFFGVKDKDLNTLNFIDRINLYTKGGAAQGIDFSEEEYNLVREVELAETFEETVAIALKVQQYMKEIPTEKIKSEDNSKDEEEAKVTEDAEEDGNPKGEGSTVDNENDNSEPTEKETAGESDDENEKSSEEKSSSSTGKNASDNQEKESIESETDKAFREKEKELYKDEKNKDIVYSNIPAIDLNKVIIPHRTLIEEIESYNKGLDVFKPEQMRSNFGKFRTESNKVVSHLVKEFEMRKNAEQQSRSSISKTGELNMSKIHEYKFTDDIFARMTKVPNGKSHGLVMFIDWSGSMHDHINATVKQLLNLVMFCKKVNIPFEVYAFSSNILGGHNYKHKFKDILIQDIKVGDLYLDKFSLLNILSHKMSASDFVKMSSYLLDFGTKRFGSVCTNMEPPEIITLSSTPLNEAIIAAFKLIPEFREKNRLEIVNTVFLTDGEGSFISSRFESLDGHTENIQPNWKKRSFMRDPITRAMVEIKYEGSYRGSGTAQTMSLLKLLKQRAECNIIGFYIAKVRDVRQALLTYSTSKSEQNTVENKMAEFKKNNFTYLNNTGYDEYYFLRSDKLDTDDEEDLNSFQAASTTTTRGLISAFSKYTNHRVSNRVVLNRFIQLIA